MADERRYGGEPRPLPPVNEQAAADLQQRINDRRESFAAYRQLNDATMRDIGDAWRSGGPSPAGERFEQARQARDAAREPGPMPGAPAPGESIQVGRAPAIDQAYVRNFAQLSANIRYRQAEHGLAREIMNASPDEVMRRMSGLSHQQYAALNPSVDGRREGDTQPVAGPGRPYPGDTDPRGQAGRGAQPGGPGQAGGPGPQQAQANEQGARSGFRMPWRRADRSTGKPKTRDR